MSGLVFVEPQWVHLLWAIAAFIALLVWLERRGSDALGRFVMPVLQARLLTRASPGQRRLRLVFLGLTGLFLTLALMRPQWGLEVVRTPRAGAEIMICLDVSNSMLAEDVAPNRLGRAKAEIRDLLAYLHGDQVGLIAFAGRATVLSPLTPDFGYLTLVLDDASPASVTRGGTRLEEPIVKAIRGFGDSSDVSRSILLITDGEDHDSFPLEAARRAAERGIRILAVGFGDEAGAEVYLTDRQTGARTLLRQADGTPVLSRLDGDLLREMALLTDGAYIPAGTGVLDLESIYERHIAPLTRGNLDGRARTIRNDAFQWAVMLAMLSLMAALASTARATRAGVAASMLWVATAATSFVSMPAPATEHETAVEEDAATTVLEIPTHPRDAYNLGLQYLESGDTAKALSLFTAARDSAGTDGEARFRTTYNLGWAEVMEADALLEAQPEAALERLDRAIGWFQEAVNLRPADDDARFNLETVMRRALELEDSLAKENEVSLIASLEALIASQRAFLGELKGVVPLDDAQNASGRSAFRVLAARELGILTDAERVNARVLAELEIAKDEASERTGEERLGAGQLERVLHHLHRSRERLAQTRTRLRRLQSQRAYRRGANALESIKRARDQLLDPVQRIDALITDTGSLMQLTGVLADAHPETSAPAWLTADYLRETTETISARTDELAAGLRSGLAGVEQSPLENSTAAADPAVSSDREHLLGQLAEAEPLIGEAGRALQRSLDELNREQAGGALSSQSSALAALVSARELFLDLRALIEVVFAAQRQVETLLGESAGSSENSIESLTPMISQLHEHNVARMPRLGRMLSDAMADALTAESGTVPDKPPAGERQTYEAAYNLWGAAADAMNDAQSILSSGADTDDGPAAGALAAAQAPVGEAVTRLEALRRLFFSPVEHVQELARRQQALNDETETVAVLAAGAGAEPLSTSVGPLTPRQRTLADETGTVGGALEAHGQAPASEASSDASRAERLDQAAKLVLNAGEGMREAVAGLDSTPVELGEVRQHQDKALEQLLEALAVLDERASGEQPQGSDAQTQASESGGEGDQPRADGNALAQLLQGIRDREAERRQQRARGLAHGEEAVEKDW